MGIRKKLKKMCLGPPETQSMRKREPQAVPNANLPSSERQRELLAMRTLPPKPAGPPELSEERVKLSSKHNKGKVTSDYKLGEVLGAGGFAVVRLAKHKISGEEFACKIIKLPGKSDVVGPDDVPREDIFKEIEIVGKANNQHVVCMKEFYLGKTKVYLILDLMRGGMLLDALLNCKDNRYTEHDARKIFMQLLKGLSYLHDRNVIHRDLKLENLLLVNQGDLSHIKIVDFGLAKHTTGMARTVCGTPQFVAPEIIRKSSTEHGKPVDLWSAGVILFMLLGGYPPFYDKSEQKMFIKIEECDFNFNDPVWLDVSESAKDLICRCLVLDPKSRITVDDARRHKWFHQNLGSAELSQTRRNILQNTDQIRKFRKAVMVVQAMNRFGGVAADDKFAPSDDDEQDDVEGIMQAASRSRD